MPDLSDALIREILTDIHVIALVGWSANPDRPSHKVAAFLHQIGKRVIPVNPGRAGDTALGQTVYARLTDIPAGAGVEMVDIFRRPGDVPEVVEEALSACPDLRVIWMQLGVTHEGAAARAEAAGVTVVRERCPKIEHPRLFGPAA